MVSKTKINLRQTAQGIEREVWNKDSFWYQRRLSSFCGQGRYYNRSWLCS